MKKAPKNTNRQANTRCRPRRYSQLSSLRKSSERSSTRDANVSSPADMAFMTPTTMSPISELGL